MASIVARTRTRLRAFVFSDRDDVAPLPSPHFSHAQTAGLLIALALIMLLPIVFFNFLYPLSPARIERPATALIEGVGLWRWLDQGQPDALHNQDSLATLIFLGAFVSFTVYALAIWLVWRQAATRTLLAIAVGGSVLFMLITLWSLPNFNTDVYDHILYGRIITAYDENPYTIEPAAFPHDPIYPYASSKYVLVTTDKLPVWTTASAAGTMLAGDDPTTNLLVARSMITLFNISSVILIVLIMQRWNPLYAVAGAITFGWNPVMIILTQGKTDPVMVFFLLLAVWVLVTQRYRLVVVFLAVATLTKLIPLPLVAIYFLRQITARRWRAVALDSLLFAVTVATLYLPFVNTIETLQEQISQLQRGGSDLPGGVQVVAVAGFAALSVWLGLRHADTDRQLLWSWALALLFFAMFLTEFGFAWYHLTFIAIAAITVRWPMILLMLLLTWSSFLLNTWRAASTPEFRLPSPDVPRLVTYLALPALALLLSAALVALRTRRIAPPRDT